jgi:hypothetical protein
MDEDDQCNVVRLRKGDRILSFELMISRYVFTVHGALSLRVNSRDCVLRAFKLVGISTLMLH